MQAELTAKDRQLSECATEVERLRQSGERARAAAADAAVATAAHVSALATTDGIAAAGDANVITLRSADVMLRCEVLCSSRASVQHTKVAAGLSQKAQIGGMCPRV